MWVSEINHLEMLLERIKRIDEAEDKARPLDELAEKGKKVILAKLKEKAPELVEPLKAVFLLQFGARTYAEGRRQPANVWAEQAAKVLTLVMGEDGEQGDVE